MKYIFLAGAPGSKWSMVARSIYSSPSLDCSDQHAGRQYVKQGKVSHVGAYWDPGMEFGNDFDRLSIYTKQECEARFDEPFSGEGIRLIKSHVFCHHLDFLRYTWPDCPIILAERDDDACLGWWIRAGGFDIEYPDYLPYYKNTEVMAKEIDRQNADLRSFRHRQKGVMVADNKHACLMLGIGQPEEYFNYLTQDVRVHIIS